MRTLSHLPRSAGNPYFVTLTYHETWDGHKADLNRWLNEVRALGGLYVWRLEYQQRGAPHYHVILFTNGDAQRLAAAWHRIAGHGSKDHARHGCRIDKLDSFRKVLAYVSKYVAKVDNAEREDGRRWGTSRGMKSRPNDVVEISEDDFYLLRRIARRMMRARNRRKDGRWILGLCRINIVSEDAARLMELVEILDRPGPGSKRQQERERQWNERRLKFGLIS